MFFYINVLNYYAPHKHIKNENKNRKYANKQSTYDSLIVVITVTTIFDIVLVISRLFTKKSSALGACNMESLFAATFVTLHAGPRSGPTFTAFAFA